MWYYCRNCVYIVALAYVIVDVVKGRVLLMQLQTVNLHGRIHVSWLMSCEHAFFSCRCIWSLIVYLLLHELDFCIFLPLRNTTDNYFNAIHVGPASIHICFDAFRNSIITSKLIILFKNSRPCAVRTSRTQRRQASTPTMLTSWTRTGPGRRRSATLPRLMYARMLWS